MNPVLLKPETDTGAQVIVQGKRAGTMRAAEYGRRKGELLPKVLESFAIVGEGMDIVLVEGAGSPAEVNLRAGDIANMGFAEAADVPVVLIGDIDRGGVIASLVGTHAVLAPADRARIKGFVVNKLRGEAGLFADGVRFIEEKTGWPCLGVVPWFDDARRLPAEDVLGLADDSRAAAASSSRCRCCRASPISTISIRCAPSRASRSSWPSPASRSRPTPHSSSFPVPNRPSPISRSSARRAGTSTSPRMSAAAGACSASAAATRCWGGRSPIPMASRGRPAPSPASACSTSRRCCRPTRRPSRSRAATCNPASA